MEMTIKQLANELGVSKTTINKVISSLGVQNTLHKVGNKYVLSEIQILQIKNQIENQKLKIENQKSKIENLEPKIENLEPKIENLEPKIENSESKIENQNLIFILEKQLALLNEQLAFKDEQIKDYRQQIKSYQEQILILTQSLHDATPALTAAQALHAGTIQKQLTEHSESIEQSSEPEQPKQKQGLFSKLFGRKN